MGGRLWVGGGGGAQALAWAGDMGRRHRDIRGVDRSTETGIEVEVLIRVWIWA